MKFKLLSVQYFLVLLISISQCSFKAPERIPTGEWKYKLYINGVVAGSAISSNRISGSHYISTTILSLGLGDTTNTTKQIITETLDFIPVKLETYNTTLMNGDVHNISTVARFSGKTIEVDQDKYKTSVKLNREFRLEGNYILSQLIKGKFKKGLEIKSYIYDPSIELETPILIRAKVIGVESVKVGDRVMKLIHITEFIENVKSIDLFLDEKGVMVKTIIQMLNTNIMLVRE